MSPPGDTFDELAERVEGARSALAALDPSEIDAFEGRPMRFDIRSHYVDFTAEQFLLSFSMPNFYFHATTAYDLLRMKGLQIGKVDFIGRLNIQKAS